MYTITVTSLADSGTGTLREAIELANAYTGTDAVEIVFDDSLADQTLILESDIEVPNDVTLKITGGVAIDITHANFYIDGQVVVENEEVKDAFVCTEVTVGEEEYPMHEFYSIRVRNGGKLLLNNASINLKPVVDDDEVFYHMIYGVYVEAGGELLMNGGSVSLYRNNVYLAQDSFATLSSLSGCSPIQNEGILNLINVQNLENLSNGGFSVLNAKNVFINGDLTLKGNITADKVLCGGIRLHSFDCVLTQLNDGIIVTGEKKIDWYNFPGGSTEAIVNYVDSLNLTWKDETSPYLIELGGVFSGDTILSPLSEGFSHVIANAVNVEPGVTLTLEEGVFLDFRINYLHVEGNLVIDWEKEADAIRIQSEYHDMSLRDGGRITLKNANIIGNVWLGEGEMTMTGGALKAQSSSSELRVSDETTAILSDVDIFIRLEPYSDGFDLTLNSCSFYNYLSIKSDSQIRRIKGGNNCFYNDCLVKLYQYSGNTSNIVSFFDNVKAENPYIGLNGYMQNCTFSKLSEKFSGGYRFCGNVRISNGCTTTLGDGVCWNMMEYNLDGLYGSLKASFSTVADALVSQQDNAGISMYKGSSLAFRLANIRLNGVNSKISMRSAASFSMYGGTLEVDSLQLVTGGTLLLDCMYVDADLNLVAGSTSTITNSKVKGSLSISAGATVSLQGNDFSDTQISVARDAVVDLSGNYWGTSDLDEIKSRIVGFNEASVIISSVLDAPATGELTVEVTNLNSSGEGSLQSAMEQVNSGVENMVHTIRVSDSLQGQILFLSSLLTCSNAFVLEGKGLILADNGLSISSTGILNDLTLPQIRLSDSGRVEGQNIVLTEKEAIILSNWKGVTDFSGITATAEGAYVYITGTLGAANLTCLPDTFSGYRLENVIGNSYICCEDELNAKNVTVNSYLSIFGNSTLENVTCARLNLCSTTDITTLGMGVTITGSEVFRLCNFKGNVLRILDSFDWTATSEGEKFVGVSGDMYTSNLSTLPDVLTGGYKSSGNISVLMGNTLTLEKGVCLQMQNNHMLYVYGTLIVNNEEVSDAIIGTSSLQELYICDGGKLQLKNANVTGIEYIFMYSGGTLEMKGGTLDTRSYLQIREGAMATLDGVTVKDYIYNYGTLSLSNSTVNNSVYVYSGSTANITGCTINGTLEISMGSTSTTITGNDFSKTTLKLTDMSSSTGVVDLSGNYWGTTNIDEIIARIQNYSEDRVLLSGILIAPPTQEFCFDVSMVGRHRLSYLSTNLTLSFNRLVDAGTVNADCILLTDSEGNRVAIKRYEVSGKKVTLYFDELPAGDYRVNCTEELKDVDGKSFTASENFANGIAYHYLQIDSPRVLLFLSNSTVTDVFSYVDVFFDQVMDDSTISLDSVHLYAPDGQEIELTQMRKTGVSGNIFYRFYFDTVSSKGTYTLSVDQSVCNDWGVEMSADYQHEIYVASPDLTVGTEVDVSTSTLGRYTTITYTVSNIGDAMTPGTWTDAVYLCRTQQWNEDEAILLGRYNRTEALENNGSYTASIKGLLSGLEPGDYYVFVRTDESDRLSEGRENNNVSATETKISIRVPEIAMEATQSKLSSANETLYYAFTPTESGSYILTVDDASATVVVTSSINGKALNKKTSAKLTHYSVFSAKAGETYYIAIKGGKDTSYTTQIQKSEFAVYDSSFSNLAAGHPSTLTLVGSEFTEGMSIYVVDENGARYDAERVTIVDFNQATVTFSLPEELAAGTKLTLYVQNEADSVVKLDEVLHVATFSDLVELEFTNMNGWSSAAYSRVGYVWKADLYAENKGGYDVSNAIILITDTAEDFAMYYSYNDAKVRDRSALLFLGGADALTPEVMTAGELSRLGVYVKHYRSGTGAIQAWLLDPNSKEEITAAQWAYFESALRPTACSDADWSAWWSDMKPRIGNTIGDFTTFIYGMRDAVSAAGQKVNVSSLADLTSITMTHCPDYVPSPAVHGTLTDNSTGEVLSGVDIYLYKIDGDKSILIDSATTDASGVYILYGMEQGGTYELKVHDFWCNDTGVLASGSEQFVCGQNEDICINGVIQQIETIEIPIYRNNYVNVEDNKGGLLTAWNENEVACISYEQNNIIWQYYLDAVLDASSKLFWSEAAGCFILSWIEHSSDDSKLFWQYIHLGESGLEQSVAQSCVIKGGCSNTYYLSSTNEGVSVVVRSNNEESEWPEVIAITPPEQFEWSELKSAAPMTSAESWTGSTSENLSFEFSPSILKRSPLLWSMLNPNGVTTVPENTIGGSIDIEKGEYAKVAISGTNGIHFWNPRGRLSADCGIDITVKFGATATCKELADEESQSCTQICMGNTIDWSGLFGVSAEFSVEQPYGLLDFIKLLPLAGVQYIASEGLKMLCALVERCIPGIKVKLGYGISFTVSGEVDFNDGKFNGSGGLENVKFYFIVGGVFAPYKVVVEGGLLLDLDIDLNNWQFVINDADFYGKISLELPWKDAKISYDGSLREFLDEGVKLLVNATTVGRALWDAGEWIGTTIANAQQYIVSWLNEDELAIRREKLIRIVFENNQKRLIGNKEAQFCKTSTTAVNEKEICLIGVGSTASALSLAGRSITLEEFVEYDEQMEVSLDTVLVDLETGQACLIDQSALENYGYSPVALTAGDSTATASLVGADITKQVTDAELYLYENQLCMVWICNLNGKYQMFFTTLENGAWVNPVLVRESENVLSSCKLNEIRDQLIATVSESDSENQMHQDIQFALGDNGWAAYQNAAMDLSSVNTNQGNTAGSAQVVSSFGEIIDAMERKVADLIGCPLPDPNDELPHKDFQSHDPNDFYGPAAYGKENWIAPQEMQFQILCENIPEENIAHAAMVTIKHKLDDAYDYSTFRLGDMMIGGNYVEISEDVKSYKARLDWTSTLGVLVDVNAFFDADTGEAVWEFVAIDPETGWIVSDPFKGLLAPNYNPPEGDGWVYYYVEPKETTVTGTTATSQAEIIFDYNEPIMTPVLSYTFDADRPEGAVTAVAATACTRYLRVDWSGTDVGSGVACYNVFVSVDGGDWELWQENITATSALFTVAEGEHRYAFFAQAIDNVGLAEALGEMMPAEEETTASGKVSSLSVENVQAVRAGDELTLSIAFSEQAVCADWAAALLVSTSAQNIDLSTGTFRYDATTHVLTWVGTVAGVPDGAQATVRLTDGAVTDANGLPFGSSVPAYTAPIELAGVVGSTYAAPALVDYNGDGLLDVLVGEVAENGKGRIRIYLNEGTAEVASFASFIYASTAEDIPIELAATGCQGAIVRLADITGDGKDEMVVGLADGTIRIFTAAEGGYWTDSGELTCAVGGESETVDVGTRAAIEFVDANGDGRTDMLVATGDGNVLLYLNTSAEGAAAFDAGRYLHDAAGRIDVGSRATVATGDFDGDGLWDMLLGTADGTVLFYRNEGSTATPLFGAAETVFAGDALLDMSSETNRVRIDVGDLNGDGYNDLVVGQSDGKVKVLYGTDGADLIGEVVVGSIPLPGVPQNVQMMVDGSVLTISWDAVAVDEAADISYEVSYLVTGAESPTVVAVSGTETTLELPDGVYSVQVRALNHGKGGDWSTAQNVTVDTVAPEVPGGVSAEGGETQAVLSWVAVADAASYELRYRKSGSEAWRTVSGTEASVTLESLDPAEYVWQVRAVDAAGNASAWSVSSTFTVTGVLPDTEQHWANGLRFDASGSVTGGYYDVNKTGSGDSNLCWAAAAANMLAWWQEQGMTATVVPDAPQGAEAIYATFTQSWENSSGVDVYGLIWWLSGDSTSSGYDDYVDAHYRGDSTTGAYYEQFYTPQTIAQHTAQVQLAEVEADTLSAAWSDIYEASGMIALGVFRSVGSGGNLSGGHSLTLWGFETNLDTGRVQEIYVTDSDDGTTSPVALSVVYDEQTGYYTIAQDNSRLNGYVLGTYTYLSAFTGKDIVTPTVTVLPPVTEKIANGRIRVTLSWNCSEAADYVLTVDNQTYRTGTATRHTLELTDGEHAYSVQATDAAGNVGTATGSFAMDATAPAVVQEVQAITGESGVTVSWQAVEDAATYTLEYATKSDFSDAQTVTGISDTAYTFTDVPGTGTLYVRVSAADTAGNVSDWSAAAQTGLDITAPVVTLNEPEVKKIADGRIAVTFSWSCSESAVYTLTVDGTEYSVRGATRYTLELADGEHVYSVKATDGAGLTGTAEGSFAMDATAPAVVQGVQAITGESGVAVSWNAVEEAASYTLEYATTADFSDAKTVTGITGTAYTLTGVPGTGTLYVRVAAVDAAGNESDWSATAESGLDITAPGVVQGLEVMSHGTSARLSWDEVHDASGIAGYRIEYAVDGDFTKAQSMQVNSTEATFYTLLAGAAYQWRVAAVDGAGNVGAWTEGTAFRTGAAEPEDDSTAESREIEMSVPSGGESHSATRVKGWVGFDDPSDYYCFTAKGEGAYAISLDAAALGTQVYLSVGTVDEKGNFAAEKKLLVAPGSAAAALGAIALESGEKCYIRVESYDKGLGRYNGEYSLSVDAEVADAARVTDNNSPDKATMLKSGGAADAALSGWVGTGDAVDYYCFELAKPAELSLALSELEAAVKVKLLRGERDGGVSQVMSRSVKAGRGLDHTLSLTSGTYFVEVASYDNGAGRYNTTYALELEKEEANGETKRFTLASA